MCRGAKDEGWREEQSDEALRILQVLQMPQRLASLIASLVANTVRFEYPHRSNVTCVNFSSQVLNTDAEGRLTMADALVYVDKTVGADKIIELSTLTGACMVALGDGMAGLWATDDDLATGLDGASKESGDKTWRMPLEDSYREQLKVRVCEVTKR